MIREYLEKIQKELIDQKRETEKKIISLENTEKENIKFIELLDEINDPNYEIVANEPGSVVIFKILTINS